jgi:hypothetical protein
MELATILALTLIAATQLAAGRQQILYYATLNIEQKLNIRKKQLISLRSFMPHENTFY